MSTLLVRLRVNVRIDETNMRCEKISEQRKLAESDNNCEYSDRFFEKIIALVKW